MSFTVFYAWESDCPNETNRSLIKEAAEEAIATINADATIEDGPLLDHDTKGTPGFPDIPNTILEKIDRCGIFLADLSFVGATPANEAARKPKLMPNSNVLIELGYAMKTVGSERIICVMNTAFGPPDELPFDLRHRPPVQYCLRPGDEGLALAKKDLAEELKTAIRAITASGALGKDGGASGIIERGLTRARQEMAEFEQRVKSGKFQRMSPSLSVLAMSLIPAKPLERHLDFSAMGGVVRQHTVVGNWEFGGDAMTSAQLRYDNTPKVACEITNQGTVHIADSVRFWIHLDNRGDNEELRQGVKAVISSVDFEGEIINVLLSFGILMDKVAVPLPWVVSLGALNVRGFKLVAVTHYPHVPPLGGRILAKDDVILPSIVIDNRDQISGIRPLAITMRPAFDYFWREFGYERSYNYDDHGIWGRLGPFAATP
jgi:hypothetical protein